MTDTATPLELADCAHASKHWRAELDLIYRFEFGKTRLQRRAGVGPLVVQKPFYPEGEVCHVYLLHPPGGIVGGDKLLFRQSLAENTHVVCTMPGASKFYRSAGEVATLDQRFTVAEEACLEWLPTETILFDGANAAIQTDVELAPGARFIGWECTALGRPAGDRAFQTGHVSQSFRLWRVASQGSARTPLLTDRLRFDADDTLVRAPWGLDHSAVMATCYATPISVAQFRELRERFADTLALTQIDDVLVARVLADGVESVQKIFRPLWGAIRRMICNRTACAPRIWNT